MATGAWPTFDVAEMAEEAFERASVEFRSGYSLRTARRSLELLMIEWAGRGLNLWTIEGPLKIDLIPGVIAYDLPSDTVDMVDHILRDWSAESEGGATGIDFPIERFSLPEYDAITNKRAPGRPTVVSIRREINPYFLVWMVPQANSFYQLVYWRLRRMAPLPRGGAGVPEIPWRFVDAMIAGLAYRVAMKSKDPVAFQKVPLLKTEYEEAFQLASDEDRDRAAFRFIPGGYEFI